MKKKLNFGSGIDYKKGFVNMDLGEENIYNEKIKTDVRHDCTTYPYPFKEDTFDYIIANCVLEHFDYKDLYKIFKEFHRISEPEGIIEIIVPYVSSHHNFHDPTQLTNFTESTIREHFCRHNIREGFKVIKSEIIISKTLTFLNKIVNLNKHTKNIYERFFCWSIPAQEIHVVVEVRK